MGHAGVRLRRPKSMHNVWKRCLCRGQLSGLKVREMQRDAGSGTPGERIAMCFVVSPPSPSTHNHRATSCHPPLRPSLGRTLGRDIRSEQILALLCRALHAIEGGKAYRPGTSGGVRGGGVSVCVGLWGGFRSGLGATSDDGRHAGRCQNNRVHTPTKKKQKNEFGPSSSHVHDTADCGLHCLNCYAVRMCAT